MYLKEYLSSDNSKPEIQGLKSVTFQHDIDLDTDPVLDPVK